MRSAPFRALHSCPLLIAALVAMLGCAEPPVTPPTPSPEDELPVDPAEVVAIAMAQEEAGLLVGETLRLELVATLEDGRELLLTKGVAWSSSALDVATVSEEGVVTGVGSGEAIIEGSVGALTATTQITVVDPGAIVSIVVTPSSLPLVAGVPSVVEPAVTATLSDGTQLELSQEVTWTSADPDRIAQLPSGEFLGLLTGWAKLTGSVFGRPVELDVHIAGTSLRTLRFTQNLYRLLPDAGHETGFRVEGVFGGRVADVTALVTYDVEHPSVDVPQPGILRVSAKPPEPANEFHVTASLSGVSGTAPVRLAPRRLFVADYGRFVLSFALNPGLGGNVAPLQKIVDGQTALGTPQGVVYDPVHDELLVANLGTSFVTSFSGALGVNGEQAPLRRFQTPGRGHMGIAYDVTRDILYVAEWDGPAIHVYEQPRRHVSGSPAPTRTVVSAHLAYHLALDEREDRLFYHNASRARAIEPASEPGASVREVGRGNDMTAIALDPQRQRLYAATYRGRIQVFSEADTADSAPAIATVSVPGTAGLTFRGIVHDPETDALYVSGYDREMPTILVFSNASTFVGEMEVAPSARIDGPATRLEHPRGLAIGW